MKTRTIEIPVCDRCSRDGIILQVTPSDGTEPFVIVRCPRHIDVLAAESNGIGDEVPEAADNGSGSPTVERAVALVAADPGKHARDYAAAGASKYAITSAVRDGLLRAEGNTSGRRYYPA